MLQQSTADRVHHMLIYKCHDLTNSTAANNSAECENVHPEARYCRANLLIAGWAVGAGVRKTSCLYLCLQCSFVV